ncbi:MAG TPA: hypothetical protein VIO33_20370 [Burkholderiaceae bacterium]
MPKFFSICTALAPPVMLLALSSPSVTPAQTVATPEPASSASAVANSNKAGKPPVDAAAARANVATKKPAKEGSQAGPTPASGADTSADKAAKGNKAGKPPVDAAASQADIATRKPAKPGAQAGPEPASAPQR